MFTQRLARFVALATLIILCGAFAAADTTARAPFNRGVNLTGWFEVGSPREIQFSRYTKEDFADMKGLGMDVVRLPINLHYMTSGAPDYTLDPLFLEFLDEVVSWSEDLGIHIILDNHTFHPVKPTDGKVDRVLLKVWPQMAARYKDRSEFVIYEILNEPHGIDGKKWARIQGEVIEAIRAIDARHAIIVGPANYNTYNDLATLPKYKDGNLIYTFHFYDPMVFTHQGADWGKPTLVDLGGVPYPSGAGEMPPVPKSLSGTWYETLMRNYRVEGTQKRVESLLDIAARFSKERNVAVFCGEFGVYIPNADPAQRVEWYRQVRMYLESKGIAWTTWDYEGGFGLFEKVSGGDFDSDLNIPLIEALGYKAPPQADYVSAPESGAVEIYRDYAGPDILNRANPIGGTVDLYADNGPASGKYAISFADCGQYGSVRFSFRRARDLSVLAGGGWALELMAKTSSPGSRLEARFLNPEGAGEMPWRMSCTLDDSNLPSDGQWHKIRVPLADMRETGAWNGSWHLPEGKFAWDRVAVFEIVAEFQPLKGSEFLFDDISIVQ